MSGVKGEEPLGAVLEQVVNYWKEGSTELALEAMRCIRDLDLIPAAMHHEILMLPEELLEQYSRIADEA